MPLFLWKHAATLFQKKFSESFMEQQPLFMFYCGPPGGDGSAAAPRPLPSGCLFFACCCHNPDFSCTFTLELLKNKLIS